MHEAAVMHVLQRERGIDNNLREVLSENRVLTSEHNFEVRCLDIFHQEIRRQVDRAVFDVTDDEFVAYGSWKEFRTREKIVCAR